MERIPSWVLILVSCLFLLDMTNCVVEEDVKSTIVSFLAKLSSDQNNVSSLNWKPDSDPCKDLWHGVVCDIRNQTVRRLTLERLNLSGILDAAMLCNSQPIASSLTLLSLSGNNISGSMAPEIANCKQLTHLDVSGNQISGILPNSLVMLSNLKRLDISSNKFSGELPEMSRISGLNVFYAQNNQLSGGIDMFDFSNLIRFNVSFNDFSGKIPDVHGKFLEDSFLGNPKLCGTPLPTNCSVQPAGNDNSGLSSNGSNESTGSSNGSSKGPSRDQILMYSGYAALGLVFILFIVYKLCTRNKAEKNKSEAGNKVAASDENDGIDKPINTSSENKSGFSRSEYSVASESGMMTSQSLIVIGQPVVNELKLEDLLRAPAELLGRGKYGSLYKVLLDDGKTVVVKRIKDSATSSNDFKQRMATLGRLQHPFVLSPLAFYCSKEEKLLVYEFQENGSLFRLIHGKYMCIYISLFLCNFCMKKLQTLPIIIF